MSPSPALPRKRRDGRADALSDDDIKRSLISGILIEEFGPEAANDAKFQDIINDVMRVLNQSSKGRRLLSLAIQQLRNNG